MRLRCVRQSPVFEKFFAGTRSENGFFPFLHFVAFLCVAMRGLASSIFLVLFCGVSQAEENTSPADATVSSAVASEGLVASPRIETKTLESSHFVLHYDARLEQTTPDYAAQALLALEAARRNLQTLLGVVANQSIAVFLDLEDAYSQEVEARFGFATIAFYDGAMHLRAPRGAGVELYALLQHEYFHAVFREKVGADQPFWLNEGLAELFERSTLQHPGLNESELRELEEAVRSGRWIPLPRLERNFVGLREDEIRLAYLESSVAAIWVQEHVGGGAMPKLFEALAAAKQRSDAVDVALRAVLGLDTAGIDQALRDTFFARLEAVSPQ